MQPKLISRVCSFPGIFSAIAILVLQSSIAEAFNCLGVKLPSNIVICSNPELTKLADERQQIYNETRARLSPEQQQQLWVDQKAWVRSYAAACGVPPDRPPPLPVPASVILCFKRAAERRAAYLRSYGPKAVGNSATSGYFSGSPGESPPIITPSNVSEVPLEQEDGIFVIPVQIDGVITLDFVIDSGATDVQIPEDVFGTLMRAKKILPNYLIGKRKYTLADGSTKEEPVFILHDLKVGNQTLHNVVASIAPFSGNLLLGQSFLSKFDSWTLDNDRHVLKLIEKSATTTPANAPSVSNPDQGEPSAATTGPAVPRELPSPLQTAFLCGRPIGYSLDQSESGSAFLGVWTGNWNNSGRLCGGLIVEKARSGGAAEVIYVYGPSRPGSKLQWTEQHRIGFLSNDGKLSFQDDQGGIFAFDLSGSGPTQAKFLSRSGRLSGIFQKLQ